MPVILLVEDDSDVRILIEELLTERGMDVRVAASDRAAQRILEREASQIAVLIADINLGVGANGFDVARRAQRLNPRIQVIYITGQGLRIGTLGVEGAVVLPKPFNPDDLADLAEALAR